MFENIKQKLSENSLLIETALSSYYDHSATDCEVLIEAQKYGLLGGGKRIRAFLVMELCRIFNGASEAALPYACAIEMIHSASLIHDDLPCMDNDDIRRGKPSTHKAFGESAALLAGDAMTVKAFEAAIKNPHLDPVANAEAIEILASSTGDRGMLAGQAIDTCMASSSPDLQGLIRLHELKTGKLISACARLACLAANIDQRDERYASALDYAKKVGLAFQIIDDILDYSEGKKEVNSFLSFMSLDEARIYADGLTRLGIASIKPYDDGTLEELALYLTVREY